jgi:uncharacterized protein
MIFNVSGLIQEGIGATRSYEVSDDVHLEGSGGAHVSGKVELLRTKTGVLVRAHLRLDDGNLCSRCLKPFREDLAIDFEEEFQEEADPAHGDEADLADPDSFLIDERHTLDLSEAVRQYREASQSIQPLCREDCAGLCAQCGSDLNDGPCSCDTGAVDPRWGGLASLASVMREGKE